MGRDEKQYNFIEDRNEEYCTKQSNKIWHHRKNNFVGDFQFCEKTAGKCQ